jgi:hypothetical protein
MRNRTGRHSRGPALVILAASASMLTVSTVEADGTPVTEFGTAGVVIDTTVTGGERATVHDAVLDDRGNVTVLASTSTTPGSQSRLVVVRYLASGEIDTGFGADGVVDVEPDTLSGRIVLAGDGYFLPGDPSIMLSETGAETIVPVAANDAAELPDGRVAVTRVQGPDGALLEVVLPNGRLDPTFDGAATGYDQLDGVSARSLAVAADGRLVTCVSGYVPNSGGNTTTSLVVFDDRGRLRSEFDVLPEGSCGVVGAVGDRVYGMESASGYSTFLWTLEDDTRERIDWASPAPLTPRPLAFDGTGRWFSIEYSTDATPAVVAGFTDRTLDPAFGGTGSVPLPDDTTTADLRLSPTGTLLAFGTVPGGYFVAQMDVPAGTAPRPPTMSKYVPLAPSRILDTRSGRGGALGPLAADSSLVLDVTGSHGLPENGVSAVVLNVTATQTGAAGYVTASPGDRPTPTVSSLNFAGPNETVANLVTVRVGPSGVVDLYTSATTHLIADVAGYYTEAATSSDGRYRPLTPQRVLDTRTGLGAPTGIVGPAGSIDLSLRGVAGLDETDVEAVVLNVTATDATGEGFVSVWPTGGARPEVSNLNYVPGGTRANLVIVPVGTDMQVSLYSHAGAHLVADIAGWFTSSSTASGTDGLFVPITPQRILDTRDVSDAVLPAGADVDRRAAGTSLVPPGAAAVVVNATVTQTPAAGFVTVYPSGDTRPLTSNINTTGSDQTIPNAVIAGLGGAHFRAYTSSGGHLVVDIAGWFTA